MIKTHFFKNNSGFSLAELMIAMAIMAILVLGMSQLNSRSQLENQKLEDASQTFMGFLREARSLAASGSTVEPSESDPTPVTPEGGFGVYFNASERKAYMFAKMNDTAFSGDVDEDDADIFDGTNTVVLQASESFPQYVRTVTTKTDTGGGTVEISDSDNESNQHDVWVIFAITTLDVSFGSTAVVDMSTAKEIETKVGVSTGKAYSIGVNKVSRFLEINLTTL